MYLFVDLLIEGRYIESLKHNNSLSGSSNQRFIWNENPGRGKVIIDPQKIENIEQKVEIHSHEEGVKITGFPVINKKWLKENGLTEVK